MKFLLNMNIPRELGTMLMAENHLCRHVGNIGMTRASDREIVEEAKQNQEAIITHDLDYGHLLAFSGESSPSVIIYRVRNIQPDDLLARFIRAWPEIEAPLHNGAIVIMEDNSLRIRSLPIEQVQKITHMSEVS